MSNARNTLFVVSSVLIGLSAFAASPDESAKPSKSVVAPPEGQTPEGVGAELKATQGNTAAGSLSFVGEKTGVRIAGLVQGLKPNSEFGFHVHEKGDCSAPDASSAGGHFNPAAKTHGHPESAQHHAGDILNLKSDSTGVAKVDTLLKGATAGSGQSSDLVGKAIVVHQKRDDYKSQPAGDSGDRIACGVIK